jgi:hypothetical protein
MNRTQWWLSCLIVCAALQASESGLAQENQVPVLSGRARITVLTCSPGPDLYSVFGHSAIRVEDEYRGQRLDEVYNYGTFEFDEDFYFKFVKGHLDYKLSRTDFGTFQQEYLYTGRGIIEQELRLDSADRQRLYALLIENYKPENRVYRYDYFYDNCSSRIGEIICKSAQGDIKLTYVSQEPYTFRDAIDNYLQHMPWSDLGIDIALGLPCDRVMDSGQDMFLPDSLLMELNFATYKQGGLVSRPVEVIPQEYYPQAANKGTPMQVFLLVLLIQVVWQRFAPKQPMVTLFDRLLLFVTGIIGVLLAFLWFGTDHQAAAWNLNLLWANPLNLCIAFLPSGAMAGWAYRYFRFFLIALVILLAGWVFFPQDLHEALLPLVAGMVWLSLRVIRIGWLRREMKKSDVGN